MTAQTYKLSIVDQQSYPCYIRISLFFPLKSNQTEDAIIESLKTSLEKLQHALPWLAGSVKNQAKFHNDFVLVCSSSDKLSLIVNHPGDKLPEYSQLSARRLPSSAVEASLFSQFSVIPDPTLERCPIFALQANFLKGALALTFITHHILLDGTSAGTLIVIFGRINSGHELSPAEIQACCPIELRHTLLQERKDSTEPCTMVSINDQVQYRLTSKNAPPHQFHPTPPASTTARLVFFPNAKLAELKADCKPSDTESWISTNDALCALIWSRITRAVHADASARESTDPAVLVTPINIRGRSNPPLPKSYLGNAFLDVLTSLPINKLTISPLSSIASTYRKTVAAVTPKYIDDTISLFSCIDDETVVTPGVRNLLITSWAELPAYSADFGPELGKAEWVRALFHKGFSGVTVLMPRKEDGLEVMVMMGTDVCDRLLEDEVFMRYAEYTTD